MKPNEQSNRREFLRGEAARKAVEAFAEGVQTSHVPAAAPVNNSLLQFARAAMAVDFQVFLPHTSARAAHAALQALEMLEELEEQMSVYRESSEISKLNRRGAHEPVVVEPRLLCLLQLALELSEQTRGAYDMTSGPLTKLWGFYRRAGRMPSPAEISAIMQCIGFDKVHIQSSQQSVSFAKEGMELNLGGIGKGYALDCMAQHLIQQGASHFLLHGGQSSVLAMGYKVTAENPEMWNIGLAHPTKPEKRLAEFYLHNEALGTSGSGSQFFHYQGKRYGHILNPRTGWPADGVLSSTVIAPTAAQADALSTAFYVGGVALAREYCEKFPYIRALLVIPSAKMGELLLEPINLTPNQWEQFP